MLKTFHHHIIKNYTISKRSILLFGICSCMMIFISNSSVAQNNYHLTKVVIDAGHGGHDPGAVGKKSKEKDVALDLALRVGKYIEENFYDVKVIYTRKTDKFVELYKRAKIANENSADLFISIHINANESSQPSGTETYVMGLHKSEQNLAVAKKENASILMEDDYSDNYEGFDPDSEEGNIFFTLFQGAFLDQSLKIASNIQSQFKEKAGRKDRGVKQAGFLVLYKTTMPGILIEAGFLSNAKEEAYLISETGKSHISSAIYRAFKKYKMEMEGTTYDQYITNKSETSIKQTPEPKKDDDFSKGIVFKVQFASSSEDKPLNHPDFRGLKHVEKYNYKSVFRYTTGNSRSIEQTEKIKAYLKTKGFNDAFVIAFREGKRISTNKAIKLINK